MDRECPKCGRLVRPPPKGTTIYPYQWKGIPVCGSTCQMMACIADSKVERTAQGGVQLELPLEGGGIHVRPDVWARNDFGLTLFLERKDI